LHQLQGLLEIFCVVFELVTVLDEFFEEQLVVVQTLDGELEVVCQTFFVTDSFAVLFDMWTLHVLVWGA